MQAVLFISCKLYLKYSANCEIRSVTATVITSITEIVLNELCHHAVIVSVCFNQMTTLCNGDLYTALHFDHEADYLLAPSSVYNEKTSLENMTIVWNVK